MSTIMFETTVTAERQLHCELPASLPVGSKLRVVIEPIKEGETDPLDWPLTDEERAIWEELPAFCAQHPVRIASTLWTIRQQAIAKGMALQTVDEILEEIRRDRADAGDDYTSSRSI